MSLHQGFQEPCESADIQAAFSWLDGADANPEVRRLKRRMLELCPVGAGDQVLDVGCGLGHEVCRLAERVGPQGRVAGIDANPAMITEARRRAAGLGLPAAFDVSDACQVALPAATFDLCRTERMLRYLDRPQAALAEMVRLARPGGSVLAFDFDSDLTVIDAPDPVLARQVSEVLDAAVPSPWIGRQLFRLFQQAGLCDVRVIPHPVCLFGAAGFALYQQLNRGTIERAMHANLITASQVAAWWAALERAAERGTFFAVNHGFIATGWTR